MSISQFPVPSAGGGGGVYSTFQVFTASGTFVHPLGASASAPRAVKVFVMGGGGGGSSGNIVTINTSQSMNNGVGGGGSGMVNIVETFITSDVPVTIGAGSAGGAAISATTATFYNGNSATRGGTSSFGDLVRAGGGTGGYTVGQSTASHTHGIPGGSGAGVARGTTAWGAIQGGSFGSSAQLNFAGTAGVLPEGGLLGTQGDNWGHWWYGQAMVPATVSTNNWGGVYTGSLPGCLASGAGGSPSSMFNSASTFHNVVGLGGQGVYGNGGDSGLGTWTSASGTIIAGSGVSATVGFGGGGGAGGTVRGPSITYAESGAGGDGGDGLVIVYY